MTSQMNESWRKIPPSIPLLRPKQVLQVTGLSRSTMYELIARGEFPNFIKLGPRASAMPQAWLDAYLAECGLKASARQSQQKITN